MDIDGQHSGPDLAIALVAPAERQDRLIAALASGGLGAVTCAETAEDLEAAGGAHAVAVLDADVRTLRSAALLRRLRERCAVRHVVLVRAAADGHAVRRALEAGVEGMVGETDVEAALAVTVRAVAAGQVVVPNALRGGLTPPALSHRERQVLALVVQGCTNGEIGQRLYLAESTVKSHLATAFAKLGVRSRRDAAAMILGTDALAAVILPTVDQGPPVQRRATFSR